MEPNAVWEQWAGIVQRDAPGSLTLTRLRTDATKHSAPGPGAIKKTAWVPMANQWLKGRRILLHTDSARSHTCTPINGVIHDNVTHKKKRVVKGG